MRFISLIVKNVLHRPVRTLLTTLGLAIAIAAVTILVGISWNFERSFLAIYNSKGIDLVVVHAQGSSNVSSPSSLDEKMADRLRPGLREWPTWLPRWWTQSVFEEYNLVSVIARSTGWISRQHSVSSAARARWPGQLRRPGDDKAVMLGRVLTMTLGKKPGDRLQIAGETFDVAGIFESDSWFENGGLLVPLKTLPENDGTGRTGDRQFLIAEAAKSDERLDRRVAPAYRVNHFRSGRDPCARSCARRHPDPPLQGDGLDHGRGRPLSRLGRDAQHHAHVNL